MASVTKSARTPQAIKRARQAEKHRVHNASLRSRFRTALKKVLKALAIGDRDNATIAYREAVRVIDKSVSKGIVHANKAARHKSRLNRKLKPA